MIPPTSIDGTDITGATIDGQDVEEITVDGQTVFTAQPPRPASGIARWRWEEDATDSWGSNDGTENGGVTYSTNAEEGSYAVEGDGVDNSVSLPSGTFSVLNQDWSLAFYIFQRDDSSFNGIVSMNGDFDASIAYTTAGVVETNFFNGSTTSKVSTSSVPLNSYTQLVATFDVDTNTIQWYLDGSPDNSGSLVVPRTRSGTNFWLQDKFGNHSDMLLDDCRLYSKTLSDTEVSNLYNTGSIS